ncbi:MAG: acetyl-CoA acetyltransferase [Dehalococcoidia bacterium]|nr:acetyl-CoA acetyltransferase [Dehalococcoidia bacterium]
MPEGIKNKVAIIGMGCTKFGELWDKSAEDLMVEAFQEALEDAGIEKKDIQAAWQGNQFTEVNIGHSALPLATTLKLPFIPVTRVENLCASGTEALRGACYAVASGACDIALALGVEKVKDLGFGGLPRANEDIVSLGTKGRLIFPNWVNPNPGMFAMMAIRYFERYGLSIEEGKKTLAKISVKSHHNGALNPKAHLRREITVEDVLKAPMIAWPLGLLDSCGVSDGAAAAILVRADMAKSFRPDPVYIKALQIAVDSGESLMYQGYDYTHVETTHRAAIKAYQEAGIENPRQEISMMEAHDCFSITELVTYEDLMISPRGKAKEDIDAGFFELDGKIPCQPDGGLKCFGHPIGASGLRMLYEMYKQLQGKVGPRQIKNPRLGLTHNLGGQPPQSVCSVCIVGL